MRSGRRHLGAAGLALLMGVALGIQIIQPFAIQKNYELSPADLKLVGSSRDDTKQYLKPSDDKSSYQFAVPADAASDTGTTKHQGRNNGIYSTSLPLDAKKGITYTDSNTKIDITIAPKFATAAGQRNDGDHMVYPTGASKLVYTHKYNGLKEDIIVPNLTKDELNYEFELALPSGVEARLDKEGNIGIYSADTTLYGNITFGSDADRAKIDKARENSEKTNLVALIPSPIVKDATGKEFGDKANFSLSAKTTKKTKDTTQPPAGVPPEVARKAASLTTKNVYSLAIESKNLKELSYPISIDPTITTTSASDFAEGNSEGMLDIDTANGLIRRSSLTGGTVGTWTTNSLNSPYLGGTQAIAYKDKMYVVNGGSDIMMSTINSTTGALGAFTSTGITGRSGIAQIYNGFFYFLKTGGGEQVQHVYAKINSNGTLGSFVSAGPDSLAGRLNAAVVIHNGYAYLAGGANSGDTTRYNTVQYAPINADGTIGIWQTATNSMTGVKSYGKLYAYNERLYITGGVGVTGAIAEVETTALLNGIPGQWTALNSFSTGRFNHGSGISNGYLYVYSGWNGTGGSDKNDIQYAQINADGTIGTWQTTTSFTIAARRSAGTTIYNNTVYLIGGSSGTPTVTDYQDIQYTKIDPAGMNTASVADPALVTTRWGAAGAVYGGRVYMTGGCTLATGSQSQSSFDDCDTPTSTAQSVESAVINSDGTINAWSTTGMVGMPIPRWNHKIQAYNGWLYVTGGCIDGGVGICVKQSATVRIQIAPNGTLTGSWTTDTSLNTARSMHYSMALNGSLFVMGGYSGAAGSSGLTSVEKATIASNGSVGAWTVQTGAPLPNIQTSNIEAAIWGNRIYVAGGQQNSGQGTNLIFYISVDGSGNLVGTWTQNSVNLPNATGYGNIVINNGYLYSNLAGVFTDFGAINADGSISSFTSGRLSGYQAVLGVAFVTNGVLHQISGCNNLSQPTCGTFPGSTAYAYARLNNGGSGVNGTWTSAQSLPAVRGFAAATVANGYIYVIGGCSITDCGNSQQTTVYYNKVQSDGSLANPWSSGTPLNSARGQEAAVVVGGYIYVLGGFNNTGSKTNTVQYNTIDPTTGALGGTWTTSSTLLNSVRGNSAVSYNGYIYMMDGDTTSAPTLATEYTYVGVNGGAPSDPGCGTTWCATTSLPTGAGTYFGAATVYGNKVYFNGGQFIGSASYSSDTYYATLSSNGIGSWTKASTGFANGRYQHATFAANGFLYIMGGGSAVACEASFQYAPILPSGDLGSWQTGAAVSTGRSGMVGVRVEGSAFFIGGQPCASPVATVDRTSLQSISRKGSYSRLLDFEKGVLPTKLITRGAKLTGSKTNLSYSTVNNVASNYTNSQSLVDIGYGGASSSTFSLGTNVTLSRYMFLRYTIDDSNSATFPDSVGGQSTITDYDINFTANPGSRLKGGRTFTNGVDRGLNAQ